MSDKMKFIDLFAGCGGLSLGLEQAGFTPVFVNELNDHALSSYLANREEIGLVPGSDTCNDIREISGSVSRLDKFAKKMSSEHGDIALIVGGPPCQGYSARGIRSTFSTVQKHEMPPNYLYEEMAKVIKAVGPKIFLFENVAGLTTARWNKKGKSGEIFRDVLYTFEKIRIKPSGLDYALHWQVVKAKDYGVPQNRPRLLLVGVRRDLKLRSDLSSTAGGYLPDPLNSKPPDPCDLLGDLIDLRARNGGETLKYKRIWKNDTQKQLRKKKNGYGHSSKGKPLSEQKYTEHSKLVTERFAYMIKHPGKPPERLRIKKFSQKALPRRWGKGGPSITATSAPDDYVHYELPRILTVREWARLQMFPDWYQFCGPRTTGGRRRAGDPSLGIWDRELPRYTQIGNAVPVKLAYEIGLHFKKILR